MKSIKTIKYKDLVESIKNETVYEIKKKRERAVFFLKDRNAFFKLWVPEWTQSKIAKHCIDVGFYDEKNAESILALVYDETGPRGYIQHTGETAVEAGKSDKSWTKFVKLTTKAQRKEFIVDLFNKSISAQGTYTDLAPSNVILYNKKINLIDLESFRSFDLIYENKKREYETFELDAWWKPHETAKRDVNKYFQSYFTNCLEIDLSFDINSYENFIKAFEVLKNEVK